MEFYEEFKLAETMALRLFDVTRIYGRLEGEFEDQPDEIRAYHLDLAWAALGHKPDVDASLAINRPN